MQKKGTKKRGHKKRGQIYFLMCDRGVIVKIDLSPFSCPLFRVTKLRRPQPHVQSSAANSLRVQMVKTGVSN